jgi:hypothetical protein
MHLSLPYNEITEKGCHAAPGLRGRGALILNDVKESEASLRAFLNPSLR